MIKNYLTVMWRNVVRHKLHAFINIIGLTAGLSFALLIGVFTWTEYQVNQGLKDVERLYFLEGIYKSGNGLPWFTPAPLLESVKEQYPSIIDSYYRFRDRNMTVSKGELHLRLQCMIGDSTFIQTFGFEVLHGDPEHNLSKPNTIVISEKTALQFFGRSDAVGETLLVATEGNGLRNFVVTAVIATPPRKNSVTDFVNMDAQVFLPLANIPDFSGNSLDFERWETGILTYMKLTATADPKKVAEILNATLKKQAPAAVSEDQTVVPKALYDYYRVTNNGAVQKLLLSLSLTVVFIVLLAVANFVNITISGSFSRLKEIGVRKVIGGYKRQVIAQFLSESIVFALLSGGLSLLIYEMLRGYATSMLNTDMAPITSLPATFWVTVLLAFIAIGLLAGIYPSWYLSNTQTLESLKGKFKSAKGTVNFSRGLLTVQFVISIFMLTCAFTVSRQINYFLNKDIGYDKSAILVVTSTPRVWTPEGYAHMESAKHEFLKSPFISSMSLSTGSPTGNFSMDGALVYRSGSPAEGAVNSILTGTDEDFTEVYGMKMKEGKYFGAATEVPPNAIVINETLQKSLSLELGDKVKFRNSGDTEYTVVGVVHDFNTDSFRDGISPVVIQHTREYLTFRHYSIKLKPGSSLSEAVNGVEREWRKVFPDDAFLYAFADDRIQLMYKTELQMNKGATLASVLMLIIVATGVLGLVSLSVARRHKEIAIRKVLGASAGRILSLLAREYVFVVIAAFVVSAPLSLWFVTYWLSTFVFHIDMSVWMFATPALILFIVTILLVCLQGIKAAHSNPAHAIKET